MRHEDTCRSGCLPTYDKLSFVSVFSQKTRGTVSLVGKVYSELGEGLEGAKVKATGKDGVSFETLTDGNGSYKLELPVRVLNKELTVRNSEISAYDIRVELIRIFSK